MDNEEFDMETISAETMKISETRWLKLMIMLIDSGYIDGISIRKSFDEYLIAGSRPEITLRGLEYLEENSLMRKAADVAKGIVDVVK